MDSPSIPTWRILILMTFYAVLVGPVNVFKLARDRRYRLYFTTPIMALAASILIFTMILISDGTGGNGRRLVASILLPNENRAIVLQEQIARTGLVLSGSFDFPEDSLLVRVPFEGPFAKSNNMPSSGAYRIAEGRRAGEWFGSRSLQAHVASVIGPSRSRVELTRSDSGELLVTSTVPAVLEKLVYRDKDDRFWTAQNIAPGERKPLTSSNGAPSWIRETYTLGGPAVQRAISSVREHEAYFLALASGSRDLAIRSHPSIAWEEEAAIFMGPVEPLGGRS